MAAPALSLDFAGVNGSSWPQPAVILAAGGASTAGATQVDGRGRLALPGTSGHPALAARFDLNLADVEMTYEVGGTWDNTTAETREHFREAHLRMKAGTTEAASSTADSYFVQIFPSSTNPGFWRIRVRKRSAGSQVTLGPGLNTIPLTSILRVRFSVIGRRVQARAWAATGDEPTAWNLCDVEDLEPNAVLAAGSVALVAVGPRVVNTGLHVDFDDVIVVQPGLTPTVEASGPADLVWPNLVELSAVATNSDSVFWSIVSRPRNSKAELANPGTLTPTLVPDTDGTWVFEVAASGGSGLARDSVTVTSKALLYTYTGVGDQLVPVGLLHFKTGDGGVDILNSDLGDTL